MPIEPGQDLAHLVLQTFVYVVADNLVTTRWFQTNEHQVYVIGEPGKRHFEVYAELPATNPEGLTIPKRYPSSSGRGKLVLEVDFNWKEAIHDA